MSRATAGPAPVDVLTAGERKPVPLAMESCGDLLLRFDDGGPPPKARCGGAWRKEAGERAGALWRQAPSEGWRGFPIRTWQDPRWSLWLLGESYGPMDIQQIGRNLSEGAFQPERLNGHFLLLGWEASTRSWHVWTDRFGTVHAYWATHDGRAALGTYFPAVAAAGSRRRLDWQAIAGFFAFAFLPHDRTFFDDVRILRPASHYVVNASGRMVEEERYWNWRHEPDPRRSYDDTVDEFAGILHQVLDDQAASGRIAVPISGGLDSRTTVAALTRADRRAGPERLWSYSYGYTDESVETRIARRVAAARGLPFEAMTIGPYLFDRLGAVLSCVEGFQDVTQSRQATVSDLLAREADAVIAAHWGDVWLDDMGLEGRSGVTRRPWLDHAFGKIAKRGRQWLLDKVAAPRLRSSPEPLLREHVGEELDRVAGIEDPDFRVKAFKTEQWSFRWTLASIRMYQAGALSPPSVLRHAPGGLLHDRADGLRQGAAAPDRLSQAVRAGPGADHLAGVRHESLPLSATSIRWLLPSRAIKKAMRALPANAGSAAQLGSAVSERARPAGASRAALLAPGRVCTSSCRPTTSGRCSTQFFAAPLEEGRGYTVSMLLTFSSWLEAYG